jgi:hypothetical protein
VAKISTLNRNYRSIKQLAIDGKIFGWGAEELGWPDLAEIDPTHKFLSYWKDG